jgi:FkbM family methyltransferase
MDWMIENEVLKSEDYSFDYERLDKKLVIDAGAHIGLFSLKCANLGADVIAIEPERDNLKLLARNIAQNGFNFIRPNKITIVPHALWYREGLMPFYRSRNKGNGTLRSFGYAKPRLVQTVALDGFLPCDILKIDVEGAEFEILENSNLSKVGEIICEFHLLNQPKKKLLHLLFFLHDRGFEFTHFVDSGYTGMFHCVKS